MAGRFGESFLSLPDLFPARLAGEAWGSSTTTVGFPGGPYQVAGTSADQSRALREYFTGFLDESAGEPTTIRVFQVPRGDFRPPPEGWHEYELDLDFGPTSVRVAGRDFMALFRPAGVALTAALWTWRHGGEAFAGVAENVLRVATAYRLVDAGQALVHSAALMRDGQALLFPGRSGAGKSTLCSLAREAGWEVLSDELNVVALDEDGARIEQLPFAGDFGRSERLPGRFPLRAMARLEKAEEDRLDRASPGEMLARLFAASPYLNRDPRRSPDLEAVLATVAEAVPGHVLGFSRRSRLEVLDELLGGDR